MSAMRGRLRAQAMAARGKRVAFMKMSSLDSGYVPGGHQYLGGLSFMKKPAGPSPDRAGHQRSNAIQHRPNAKDVAETKCCWKHILSKRSTKSEHNPPIGGVLYGLRGLQELAAVT